MPSDNEVVAAIDAVRAAGDLCVRAQGRLAAGDTLTKGDDSPVTVADFAAQAVVCASLQDVLGEVVMIGEEDAGDLADRATLLAGVTELVRGEREAGPAAVLDWISIGRGAGSASRYWTLDPIDGTKGFLRGDQYAVALGLIDDGEVVLGVLGCPNLPNPDGSIGATFAAVSGRCVAYYGEASDAVDVRVAAPATVADARFCESVESGHSDQDQSAQIASLLGLTTEPYRIDSQCKYAAVARGDASIYLRLPTRADYREKIWDHAAGKFVVEQAGGCVTDVTGAPLDFSHGARLEANRGVVATAGGFHDEVVAAVMHVLGT
ncbi:MAG: 3'(2'),5'-bisphosphate nucleotidase [Ilumatobacter sp.]|nr:3'(2'),5'-bisphosphate nucleotidase [Ilumatobacter sp.]